MKKKKQTVVIAGRPNVGKSTLFNRLVGKAMAIIDDQPGVTRDWREGDATLFDLSFRLLDTAGLEAARPKGSLAFRTADRTREALDQAALVLFMIDGQMGVTAEDKTVAREVRKMGKPVVLLVNKCEGAKLPAGYHEAQALGFAQIMPLSAQHGEGLADLYDALKGALPDTEGLPEEGEDGEAGERLHIAVAGRPNAGKSTLINRLIGEERLLTGPEPGLTRDAIPILWAHKGQPIRLVDTAGLRRRARVEERLEKLSVKETLRAIRLAHVVILVIDATQPFDKQDYTIAQHVAEEGRALVVAVNKWDLIPNKRETLRFIQAKIEASLAQISGVPLVTLSALEGEGLGPLMKAVERIYETWNSRITTGQLNRWLEGMTSAHPLPIVGGRRLKIRYATQVKARPPTFALWVNKPLNLPESYLRFLTNGLRQAFKLDGIPVRWLTRKGDNPYEDNKKR